MDEHKIDSALQERWDNEVQRTLDLTLYGADHVRQRLFDMVKNLPLKHVMSVMTASLGIYPPPPMTPERSARLAELVAKAREKWANGLLDKHCDAVLYGNPVSDEDRQAIMDVFGLHTPREMTECRGILGTIQASL